MGEASILDTNAPLSANAGVNKPGTEDRWDYFEDARTKQAAA